MRGSRSFSSRLTLAVMTMMLIFFICVMGLLTNHFLEYTRQESIRNITNTLQSTINEVNGALSKVETAASNMVWSIQSLRRDESSLYEATAQMVRSNPDVVGSTVAFEPYRFEGKEMFSPFSFATAGSVDICQRQLDYDYFGSDWYAQPKLLGRPCWSEPYFDKGGADIYMSTYSTPMFDESGRMYAIFTADISLEWLTTLMSELKPFVNSTCILISHEGRIVCQPTDWQSHYETIDELVADNEELTGISLDDKKGGSGFIKGGKGYSSGRYVVYDRISNGWTAVLVCPYEDVFADVQRTANYLLVISGFFFILLFVVLRISIRKMTRPLTSFSKSAMSIAEGNFHTLIPEVKSRDEFYDLGKSIDYMQRSLNTYVEDLQSTTAAKERIESELNIARDIQMNMLPHTFPVMDGYDISALLLPAKEVGGDLYHVLLQKASLAFTVGDVSGKGVPASLIMANTKTALSILAGSGFSMAECIMKINNLQCEHNDDNMFVTMVFCIINTLTSEMYVCNCGHNPMVMVSPEGKASMLEVSRNLPLGVMPSFEYKVDTVKLQKGSRLVIYTDGVTEAEDSSLDQFGEERLLTWAESIGPLISAEDACNMLLSEVKSFTGSHPQNDDITIMVVNC